jgi:16S rRNA (cytidine1402-2'-O)-methyltransferase
VEGGAPAGRLYVVSTPIGNLGDMTPRAVEVLAAVSLVLAEDTRHSRPLLERFGVTTPMAAHHEHNEAKSTAQVLERLARGQSVAVITDAGTPLVSDPGGRLVAAAAAAGVEVVAVPGASALLAGLVVSGLPADRFTFFGFLARKGRDRTEAIRDIAALRHTAVLYEAPGRVGDTLSHLREAGAGDRPAAVARELTKQFEQVRRGTVEQLAAYYNDSPPRGEVVIIVGGATVEALSEDMLEAEAERLRSGGASARDVQTALVAAGAPRNLAYRLAHGV